MLISHAHKLIFVHIQKTGGKSMDALLRAHVPDVMRLGFRHDHAAWHRDAVPDWDGYFKFAFVRNPWDRLVSWHSKVIAKGRPLPPWLARLCGRDHRNYPSRYVWGRGRRFEDFVLRCTDVIEGRPGRRMCYAWNQLDYLTDARGQLLVDFVGRFEHFQRDTRAVLERAGLADVAMVHTNASGHTHYSQYYTDRLREVVAQRFARDIAAFDYHFESAPRARIPAP